MLDLRSRVSAVEWLKTVFGDALTQALQDTKRLTDRRRPAGQVLRLVDLYYRSERRVRQGAYADALNAVWILRELVLSFHLQQTYGVHSQMPEEQSSNRDSLERLRSHPGFAGRDWKLHIDAYNIRSALTEVFGDESLKVLNESSFVWGEDTSAKTIKGADMDWRLNDSRNDHEHRGKQINREVAEAGLAYGRALLDELLPEARSLLDSYSFRPDALEAMQDRLRPHM